MTVRDRLTAIRQLPKVELHCHLEGAMRGGTLLDLSRRHGIPLASLDPGQVRRFDGFDDFFAIFRRVQAALRDRQDWYRLGYESAADAVATGIRYRECFVTPTRCLLGGTTLGDVIAGLAEGFDAAAEDLGIECFLIVDVDRSFDVRSGRQLMDELGELIRGSREGVHRVIGAGMDGPEDLDPGRFVDAFTAARRAGLRLTSHQGGECPPENIRAGLDVLGCERIDHGLTVVDDAELLARCRDDRIPLTVCPTSNLSVGRFPDLHAHPFARMRAEGLLATIHTDDPTFIGNDLSVEYDLIAQSLDLDWNGIVELACDAVESSWMGAADKSTLLKEIAAASAPDEPVVPRGAG